MLDLEQVMSRVERVELSAPARERHLALLHALQAPPGDGWAVQMPGATPTHAPAGPKRSRPAVAGSLAAAAVAVVAAASALLIPANHRPAGEIASAAGSSTVQLSRSTSTERPTGKLSTGSGVAANLFDAAFSKQLAAVLRLTDARASAVTAELAELGRQGSLDPASAKFATIAASGGVSAPRLAMAIDQVKKAQPAANVSTNPALTQSKSVAAAASQVAPMTDPSGVAAKTGERTPAQNLLTTDSDVQLLASTLGLTRQRAGELAGKLAVLDHGAGLDPRSNAFQRIAGEFGLTAGQLAGGIDAIKKAGN